MSREKPPAWGGVVVDARGLLLLRRPTNLFDGYAWTFPKGRPDDGEVPAACALREVLEETGVQAEVVAALPGRFDGGSTRNGYFLMRPLEIGGSFDPKETEAVAWAAPVAAQMLLRESRNPAGRKRDLAVLAAAIAWRRTAP